MALDTAHRRSKCIPTPTPSLRVGRLQREGDELNGASFKLQSKSNILIRPISTPAAARVSSAKLRSLRRNVSNPFALKWGSQGTPQIDSRPLFHAVKIQLSHITVSQERPIKTTNKRASRITLACTSHCKEHLVGLRVGKHGLQQLHAALAHANHQFDLSSGFRLAAVDWNSARNVEAGVVILGLNPFRAEPVKPLPALGRSAVRCCTSCCSSCCSIVFFVVQQKIRMALPGSSPTLGRPEAYRMIVPSELKTRPSSFLRQIRLLEQLHANAQTGSCRPSRRGIDLTCHKSLKTRAVQQRRPTAPLIRLASTEVPLSACCRKCHRRFNRSDGANSALEGFFLTRFQRRGVFALLQGAGNLPVVSTSSADFLSPTPFDSPPQAPPLLLGPPLTTNPRTYGVAPLS
ncbi:hypothetical protein BASA62_005090 [Batrachochytrium salamandrivorans]|nr:hypothetical protein BASA62_005090 [Batrachochytrium salamandrivorans]